MSRALIIIFITALTFSYSQADTQIQCRSKIGTPIGESAWMDLTIVNSEQISGTVAGMSWDGLLGKYVEFKFKNKQYSVTNEKTPQTFSSGEIQKEVPRYKMYDQRVSIGQESVSVILISFNKLKTTAELFFYQRFYLYELFADGGQKFFLDCSPKQQR